MKMNELVLLGDAVETIHKITHASITTIVDALTGIVWKEEDAEQIKRYHICPEMTSCVQPTELRISLS